MKKDQIAQGMSEFTFRDFKDQSEREEKQSDDK